MLFQFLVLKQYNTTNENLCYLYFQVNQDEMTVPTLCVGLIFRLRLKCLGKDRSLVALDSSYTAPTRRPFDP